VDIASEEGAQIVRDLALRCDVVVENYKVGSLAKYGIAYSESESDEALTAKLAQFYADRTLTRSPITPADQAEAYFLLLSDRLSKTTGQIVTVDGGLVDAFLR
jgi:enoyl-[acyl-carrier-protein] reductase (NADH)